MLGATLPLAGFAPSTTGRFSGIHRGKLKARYGDELDTPEYRLDDEGPYERLLAHQFAYIHQHAKQETQAVESPEKREDEGS